ncbi:50S ribosomal protein L30 [Thermofilum pendens]|uniref:Large ribosomal subunit protein uL30 n=1 Tax=Thermofilum pendens (strain DSM 2475 / Hrk 5) TaxID=368408 RepID=RL30_THEPD|nr:50S ribosomal protein L30 [Thermofilum pendens]A1RWR5.1 RecName: Full=Large ribosomal subunit protein uL30; AltName: Full=50S ribosomal protein L30 [Thermofilum pendens Hrk 5]ABL77645.1 LSU ribosomal protein L30P [Thermofilum pendens Hrk 5]
MALYLVIRLRGQPDRRPEEEKALELLRLHKVYHAVLVKDDPSIKGMLERTLSSAVTWGEINKETLVELLKRRGRITGNKRLTEEYLKKIGFNSFEELAEALISGKVSLEDLPGVKPVFRLRPPSGGFRGTIRRNINARGELGYRGADINNLVLRML